jgi:hypothetical protein
LVRQKSEKIQEGKEYDKKNSRDSGHNTRLNPICEIKEKRTVTHET